MDKYFYGKTKKAVIPENPLNRLEVLDNSLQITIKNSFKKCNSWHCEIHKVMSILSICDEVYLNQWLTNRSIVDSKVCKTNQEEINESRRKTNLCIDYWVKRLFSMVDAPLLLRYITFNSTGQVIGQVGKNYASNLDNCHLDFLCNL